MASFLKKFRCALCLATRREAVTHAPQTCAPTVRALPRSAILFKNKERRKALFVFD